MRLFIAHCGRLTHSETFIAQHVEHLYPNAVFAEGFPPKLRRHLNLNPGNPVVYRHQDQNCDLCIEILRNELPEIVLAEYGPSGVLWSKGCERFQIPLVIHFHGFDLTNRTVLDRYRSGYQQLFHQAKAFVVPSIALGEKLSTLGAPEQSIVVSPCGVDTDVFLPGSAPFTSRRSIVFVGRFVEKKRPLQALHAFAEISGEFPQIHFELFGDGPLLPHCKEFVVERGLTKRVTFYGNSSHQRVRSALQFAYFLVLPSEDASSGDSEGLPVVLMEAGACGVPVISTYHSGIPELVISGETGLLLNTSRGDTLEGLYRELLSDPSRAAAMGRAARARVEESFSQETSLARLRSVLKSAAAKAA